MASSPQQKSSHGVYPPPPPHQQQGDHSPSRSVGYSQHHGMYGGPPPHNWPGGGTPPSQGPGQGKTDGRVKGGGGSDSSPPGYSHPQAMHPYAHQSYHHGPPTGTHYSHHPNYPPTYGGGGSYAPPPGYYALPSGYHAPPNPGGFGTNYPVQQRSGSNVAPSRAPYKSPLKGSPNRRTSPHRTSGQRTPPASPPKTSPNQKETPAQRSKARSPSSPTEPKQVVSSSATVIKKSGSEADEEEDLIAQKVNPMQSDFHFYAMDKKEEQIEIARGIVKRHLSPGESKEGEGEELDPCLVMTCLNERLMKCWEHEKPIIRATYFAKEEEDRRRFMTEDEIASRHCATLTARAKSPKSGNRNNDSTIQSPVPKKEEIQNHVEAGKVTGFKRQPCEDSENGTNALAEGESPTKKIKENKAQGEVECGSSKIDKNNIFEKKTAEKIDEASKIKDAEDKVLNQTIKTKSVDMVIAEPVDEDETKNMDLVDTQKSGDSNMDANIGEIVDKNTIDKLDTEKIEQVGTQKSCSLSTESTDTSIENKVNTKAMQVKDAEKASSSVIETSTEDKNNIKSLDKHDTKTFYKADIKKEANSVKETKTVDIKDVEIGKTVDIKKVDEDRSIVK